MAQRPPRAATLDPFVPYASFLEEERAASGGVVSSGTILLTNKECPWRCLMCDLWKNTLTETVPLGAIPKQIEFALAQFSVRPEQLKLYNSGSFFDSAAIPLADYPDIARAARAQGDVDVRIVIDEGGNVIEAQAVSGHPLLRTAAVNAALAAKFNPTRLSGEPVKVSGLLTYNFLIQ